MIAMVPLLIGNIGPGAGEGSQISCGCNNIWRNAYYPLFLHFILRQLCMFLLNKKYKKN